jgi:superfamily II DNA or RNA helicase
MRGMVYLDAKTISEHGYSPVALKSLLTLQQEGYTGKTTEHRSFVETKNGMYVPRAFLDFQFYEPSQGDEGYPLQWSGTAQMTLRDYQEEAVAIVKKSVIRDGGALLVGGCGTGKTVMGCFLIKELGRRSLVLVHKEFLMEQFKTTLEQAFPEIKVGIWQKDDVPTGEEDVVISMVQSLGSRDYPQELYEGFGLILTDEVHRFSAPQWSEAIGRFGAKYRIGLTATPDRVDGLETIFMNAIGPIVHRVEGNLLSPHIFPIQTGCSYPFKSYSTWDGQVSTTKLINEIAKDNSRSDMIAEYALRAVAKNRKVIILTDRRNHVEYLAERCSDQSEYKVYTYLGGMKKSARQEAEENADILVGTYSMAQEGLDIPRLDTLIFATPKTNIIQAVGRILRPHSDKQQPVVLDFIDNIGILEGYFKKRRNQYTQEQYVIKKTKTL